VRGGGEAYVGACGALKNASTACGVSKRGRECEGVVCVGKQQAAFSGSVLKVMQLRRSSQPQSR
jgi:hypothetical protein